MLLLLPAEPLHKEGSRNRAVALESSVLILTVLNVVLPAHLCELPKPVRTRGKISYDGWGTSGEMNVLVSKQSRRVRYESQAVVSDAFYTHRIH